MCGLAGIARRDPRPVDAVTLRRMGMAIRHRGPDGFGVFAGERVGFAHLRLSVIDIRGGAQPLGTEDGSVVIAYDGEVYNYFELRRELGAKGHRFRTRSDTEVLVHAYEEWGEQMLHHLNGQFAFAIYDRRREAVFLARDRFGVRPLFYALRGGDLYFGSEVKAIFASGEVQAEIDPHGLDEVFTFWGARPPRTVFREVQSLEPGTYALWRHGQVSIERYYQFSYLEPADEPADALEALDELIRSAVQLRLRADVPVGGYLSGGLDSSITCALAAASSPHDLRTFSVSFSDLRFDESAFQHVVARKLGSMHIVEHIDQPAIGRVFPDVVRHAETPLVRTAPAPMYLLARLARHHGIKVVLTGDGADESFLGSELFRETALRLFCLRQPESAVRRRLIDRLHPYLGGGRSGEFWRRFFLTADSPGDPAFSHLPRFHVTSRIKEFYSADMRESVRGFDPLESLHATLPTPFMRWEPEHRAAHLEMVTLLSPYVLSSQGDRMSMAHGVQGRAPFLDHRLFEFAAALPTWSKLRGLREKAILRRWAKRVVPESVARRPKQAYRVPDVPAFFGASQPEYVRELLDAPALRDSGLFEARAVAGLVRRCETGRAGSAESQALVGILSTQLWHQQFVARPTASRSLSLGTTPEQLAAVT